MPNPPKPSQPNTYAVQNVSNEEVKRLQVQDEAAALSMGLISDQPNPERFQRILDVACGSGGWLIAIAKRYPEIPHLIGVDVNERMLDYARARAKEQQVDDRIEF